MTYEEVKSASIWQPEKENEVCEGVVAELREGDFGKQYLIDSTSGKQWTPSHKVLQGKLVSANAQVGTKVRLTYEGEEPPKVKGQSPTKMYKVEVDK